eukprot:1823910-Amphidinium_carterae.1
MQLSQRSVGGIAYLILNSSISMPGSNVSTSDEEMTESLQFATDEQRHNRDFVLTALAMDVLEL